MPISKYFKGKGSGVMKGMKEQYGEEKGESVFYATANKQGMRPGAGGSAIRKRLKKKAGG